MKLGCVIPGMVFAFLIGGGIGEFASEWFVPFLEKEEALPIGARIAGHQCQSAMLAVADCQRFTVTILAEQIDGWRLRYDSAAGAYRIKMHVSRRGRVTGVTAEP